MNCFYCKDQHPENELVEYISHEFGCEDCIEELYGGLL
jgi:hypothetical protein|tara:strand:- start:312 stop:425 length:114 start_codon:yes stop_codon:yes gene_type:complete